MPTSSIGQSAGQARPLPSFSVHAAAPNAAARSTTYLRQTDTLALDVEAINDSHDHGIHRSILRHRRQAGGASGGVQHNLTNTRADTVDGDDVAALLLQRGRHVLDHQQLERRERRILPRRDDGTDDLSELHAHSIESGMKGRGSSSASDHAASSPRAKLTTGSAGANSTSTCRQMPHGGVGSLALVTSTSASKERTPLATADVTAVRSAQIAAPYDAFSTLQPVMIDPSLPSSAAPTWKCEYGAYARPIALSAAARSFSTVARSGALIR